MNPDNLYPNVEIGRTFPQEYLEILADQLEYTLYDWFLKQGAPEELVDALCSAAALHKYASWMESNQLGDACADDIPSTVATVVRFIKMFGGKYADGGYSEVQFESEINWRRTDLNCECRMNVIGSELSNGRED